VISDEATASQFRGRLRLQDALKGYSLKVKGERLEVKGERGEKENGDGN
jgi:hypothetical protein